MTKDEALAQEREAFRQEIAKEGVFEPVINFNNEGVPKLAPTFGELQGGGRRWIIKDITDEHVYLLQPEGGPYLDGMRELQGEDDELWAGVLEELGLERAM